MRSESSSERLRTMATLKIRKIGNSYGLILSEEMISKLKVEEGDRINAIESPDGYTISSFDADFEQTIVAFEDTYRQYRNAFRELAK